MIKRIDTLELTYKGEIEKQEEKNFEAKALWKFRKKSIEEIILINEIVVSKWPISIHILTSGETTIMDNNILIISINLKKIL